jgi:hypothetical protein
MDSNCTNVRRLQPLADIQGEDRGSGGVQEVHGVRGQWEPDVLEKVSLTPYSLNFIFGPRQIGKSTALILLVKRLLERGESFFALTEIFLYLFISTFID